jgi:outer membrane protein assembly factor BamB
MTRGPHNDLRQSLGFALTAGLLACCAPTSSPVSLAWGTHLPGAIDGTPAIAGDMVIAGSEGGDLAGLDQQTGHLVWRRSGLGAISDSPTVASGRVFVGTLSGHVLAFAASDGAPAWDWTAPPNAAFWSSPVVYRGIVIIGVSSPYGDTPLVPGRIVGLDAETGAVRWTFCLRPGCAPGDGVWSTAAIDASGVAFIGVGNPDDGVLAFDPLTGARKWQSSLYPDDHRDLDVGTRPLIVSAPGRELIEVGAVEGTFAALDAGDGGAAWARKIVEGSAVHGLIASPAYDGTFVYGASASPTYGVFALQAASGDDVWRHATALPVYSAPVPAHGAVVFGTGNVFGDLNAGSITALATADGRELWSYSTGSAVRSGPAVDGDHVFVGDAAGEVIALRVSSFS